MYKRGDIYFAKIIGHGNIQNGIRPVVIIQNDIGNKYSPTLIVAVLTSRKMNKNMPTHVFINKKYGLDLDSKVLAEQITTINKTDIVGDKVCNIPSSLMQRVDNALAVSLGLNTYKPNRERELQVI